MNTWKTLYIKEIKDNRTLFILLPLLTVFLGLVAVQSFDDGQTPSPHFLWSLVPYAFLLILPFLLSHSFAQEVKGQTHYLLLSLPVSRTQIFAAKAAAVATLGIVLFALSSAGFIAVLGEFHALAAQSEEMTVFKLPPFSGIAVDTLVVSGMVYLSAMAVMMGIAGGTSGLKLVVRRFTGLASAAFVLGVLYLYFSTLPDVLDLPEVLGTYEVTIWSDYDGPNEPIEISPDTIELSFMFVAYSILVGLASMGIGMWLFEKRAEA